MDIKLTRHDRNANETDSYKSYTNRRVRPVRRIQFNP